MERKIVVYKTNIVDVNVTCYRFGNGAEIENEVYGRTDGPEDRTLPGAEKSNIVLPIDANEYSIGMHEVVKIHFLPTLSNGKVAYEPKDVPKDEKKKIGADCLEGFITMAEALAKNSVEIEGLTGDDFYLQVLTNPFFATFLRQHCNFFINGSQGWMLKSEFSSDENIEYMKKNLVKIKNTTIYT